jgi:heme exporter protein CcmD
MKSIVEFMSMGGYGAYVWSAYGLGFLLLVGNLYWTKLRRFRMKHSLRQFIRRNKA